MDKSIMTPVCVREKVAQYICSRDFINEYKCPACGNAVLSTAYHAKKGKIRCRSCRPRDQHKTSRDPRYVVWTGMKQRCENPKSRSYAEYGGRGIKICKPWKTFSGFMKWDKFTEYQPGLQIDRIENSGDYSPENCRWVDSATNARNTRTCKITQSDVYAIRMLAWSGLPHLEISKIFSITKGSVSHIVNFRRWGNN